MLGEKSTCSISVGVIFHHYLKCGGKLTEAWELFTRSLVLQGLFGLFLRHRDAVLPT